MASSFRFKQFSVLNEKSALKVGTDAVLLGAAMTLLPEDRKALDIGTGTGIIALMAAQRAPQLQIEAIDIDGPSAEEAAANFANSPWPDRLHARHCALSEYAAPWKFDLIFSNPPYYDNSLRNPALAEIFEFASAWLTEGGRLSLILPRESDISSRRVAASFGFRPIRSIQIRTVETKPPKRIIMEFNRHNCIEDQETITLMKDGDRSPEYASLTSGFYLDSSHK